ncbi:MAG: TAXI family TRAP transporter solute-binding subunit [Magnetococcales bacterium]|nr:TAXI family TRAP transporter solute-binding subunit [Magnetococcales bacterium]
MKKNNKSRTWISTVGVALGLMLIGLAIAYRFVEPSPPMHLVLATGSEGGAYHRFGLLYQERLKEKGVSVELRQTSGSRQNYELLSDEKSMVQLGFVQGGVGDVQQASDLRSLASVYYEPVWVFVRQGLTVDRLTDLSGKRVVIGPVGSGSHALATRLLADMEIVVDDGPVHELGPVDGAKALMEGDADAVFFVAGIHAPVVTTLLESPGIRLMNWRRTEALARHYSYLSGVRLAEGAVNLKSNIPAKDTNIVATTATLVSRSDLHPALAGLLLNTLQQIHQEGDLLADPGRFPSKENVSFQLSGAAERFFKHGPPFLQRYLPFWAAIWLDRMKVMLLPLITLMIPLVKIMPPLYRWRIRSKIYKWYRKLGELESAVSGDDTPEALKQVLARLDKIEQEAAGTTVPLSYAEEFYQLRTHFAFVRNLIQERLHRVSNV